MADSPYTGVEHIEPNQAQKEVTANNGFDRLSLFVAETTALTITGDTLLTEQQFQEAVRFDLGGTPAAGFLFELPSTVKKFFIVNNGSGQTATVQVAGGGGASVNVNTGAQFLLYSDGTDVIVLSSGTSNTVENFVDLSDTPGAITAKQRVRGDSAGTALEFVEDPLDVGIYKPGIPTGSEVIARWVSTRAFTFPSGLTGSQAYAATAPADGTKDFDVQKNGASVGTVSFALGSNTATFTMASATSFVAGDRLTFVAPATADSALADIAITLKGTKD